MKDNLKAYEAFVFQECQTIQAIFDCMSLFREHWQTLCPGKKCPLSQSLVDRILTELNAAMEKIEIEHGYALKAVVEAQFAQQGITDAVLKVVNMRTGEEAHPTPEEDEIGEEYHKYFGVPKSDIN